MFRDALLQTQNKDAANFLNPDRVDSDLADSRIRGVQPAGAQAIIQTERLPEGTRALLHYNDFARRKHSS